MAGRKAAEWSGHLPTTCPSALGASAAHMCYTGAKRNTSVQQHMTVSVTYVCKTHTIRVVRHSGLSLAGLRLHMHNAPVPWARSTTVES